MKGLVYVGRIVELADVLDAHFIKTATVVCGPGGRWRGVVRKADFNLGELVLVYLPDSQLPETEEFQFMERHKYRVKMCRFRGSPSEVLIMKIPERLKWAEIGEDLTQQCRVIKYEKPIPASLQGPALGYFPSFIPKTDELNYQRHPELVEKLIGQPYYVTEKLDGSSTTAYRYKGKFGVCSRNLELQESDDNGFWKVAKRYKLHENLPEGVALQWETCGPKVQGNPLGLKDVEGFAFSAFNIVDHSYLPFSCLIALCEDLRFPMAKWVGGGLSFSAEGLDTLGEGTYSNGRQREGVVVRSQINFGHAPISFKVINLNYEK